MNKKSLRRATGLSGLQPVYFFPVTGDTQCCDGKDIIKTSKKNHTCIEMQLYIAIIVFC